MTGDPLFADGVDWGDIGIVGIKVLVAFAALLVATMFMIWFERKLISDMQHRIGPNVAGPWGLLQALADGIKFFFKEDLRPANADPLVFRLAPYISAVTAFVAFAIVPIGGVFTDPASPGAAGRGGTVTLFGKETILQVADPPVGILLLLAMSSVAVYGVMLAGWSSGSKYPLIGSVRASAQAISYEAALGMSVVAVVIAAGSLSTQSIVSQQVGGTWWGGSPDDWFLLTTGIVPFVVFLISATAELNRPPFDLVEAEQELVGGFHTEYSSIRFALFFLAEFMNVITMSAIMVTLFFGGPAGPIFFGLTWLWPTVWFLAKVLAFLFVFVWFRATLPRLRYDQLMSLGWKVLIPVMLFWLMFLGLRELVFDQEDWNLAQRLVVTLGLSAAGLALGWTLLAAALRAAKRNTDTEGLGDHDPDDLMPAGASPDAAGPGEDG
ncbi:NADH-quinone oxidoreductase subunit NuoH [Candidatus Poriferisodalis sp.]|uniref:NADH-quinone oxidoreductase subunit NuoH n=1 Tax=Candidatus Poriferisodalis sp. TaxID=3101277 RepID=UPI003B5B4931